MYVPRATYSLRMSFCTVPDRARSGTPCRRATATYSASRMIAVALMVIDVDTRSSGMPSNSSAMSSRLSIATPTRPTSPCGQRVVRVVAHLRRQVEGDAQAGDALCEQIAVAPVRLRRGPEPRVLPHRPQPAPVHRRLDAAREREGAGKAEVGVRIPAVERVGIGKRCAHDRRAAIVATATARHGRQRNAGRASAVCQRRLATPQHVAVCNH